MKKPRKKSSELADWKQAAGVEAGLRREFKDRAEASEELIAMNAKRMDWLRRKHDKAVEEHHFVNGYRAGLQCAMLAMFEGRDILGDSIDKGEAKIR